MRKVWFVMPAYYTARFIGEAIRSIAKQTYGLCQVIVVDDGSSDDTALEALAALHAYGLRDSTVTTIQHQGDHSVSAMNEAFRRAMAAGAEVIARLDSDDVQDPTRIEKQMALLEAGADIASTGMYVFAESGAGAPHDRQEVPAVSGMQPQNYAHGNKCHGPCCGSLTAWARVYEKVGLFDPKWMWAPDSEWNFRALNIGGLKWAHVPEPLYGYRQHRQQMTKRYPNMGHSQYLELCRLHNERLAKERASCA